MENRWYLNNSTRECSYCQSQSQEMIEYPWYPCGDLLVIFPTLVYNLSSCCGMKSISFGGGTYSSYSASDHGQEAVGITFYHDFVKTELFRNAKIVSWQIKEQELGKNVKPFTVYLIEVSTADIEYRVERRYSSFRNLYKKMSNSHQKSSYFPKLTLFSSGVDETVVSQRFRALNEFISQIFQQQRFDDMVMFFEFIDLRGTYEREGISLLSTETKGSVEDELSELMMRLGFEPEEAVSILNDIQNKLLESRIKVSGELIRIIYQGFGKKPGLFEVSNNCRNEMICLRVMEMILKLTSFEHNRDAEMFCKGLASITPKLLILENSLLEFSKIKINYFKVLEIFLKRNNEINVEDILDMLFKGNPDLTREFNMWLNSRQKTSIVAERLEERSPDRRSGMLEELRGFISQPLKEWETVKTFHGANSRVTLRRTLHNIYRITMETEKTKQKLKEMFIENSVWRRLIEKEEQNEDIVKIWLKISTHLQLFMFEEEISNEGSYYQRIRKPPVYLRNALSFFEIIQCYPNKAQMYLMLNSNKVRELFTEKTLCSFCQHASEQ